MTNRDKTDKIYQDWEVLISIIDVRSAPLICNYEIVIFYRPTERDPYIEPIGFLVPEDAKNLRATITFQRIGASPVRWSYNNKNLLELPEFEGWLFLDDSMWKKD